jgi:methyl-accepting chemotaxis protein
MFKSLTIGKKVAFGFATILILTVILSVVGVFQIRSIDSGVMDLTDLHIPLTRALSAVDSEAANQHLAAVLYAIHKEQKYIDELTASGATVDKELETATQLVKADGELVAQGWPAQLDEIDKAHNTFETAAKGFIDVVKKTDTTESQLQAAADNMSQAYEQAMGKIDHFLSANEEMIAGVSKHCTSTADTADRLMLIVGAIAVMAGVLIAVAVARSIVTVLKRIIQSLSEGAEQVASASGQVSSASQSLAEGATEQAAGLEETSSSLEEMSAMTKQNADNAQQANVLAAEAKKAANNGAEAMSRMSSAINSIQKSSDETAKIIKVIDEIAFQTNLLALNAAVEAARAGEAGKGFAVVAEEVRNLAMRSAEAAKNTSAMIEESVKNSKNGVDISVEVAKVLTDIVASIGKTTDLVAEIAAASQEQARGVDQVNTAVSQMDKVTQQNAANAEESASASEELSAQAASMKEIVSELVVLVGGSQANRTAEDRIPTGKTHGHGALHSIAASKPSGSFGRKTTNAPARAAAEKAIPMDDHKQMEAFNN